jgi:hypothetical protein
MSEAGASRPEGPSPSDCLEADASPMNLRWPAKEAEA